MYVLNICVRVSFGEWELSSAIKGDYDELKPLQVLFSNRQLGISAEIALAM